MDFDRVFRPRERGDLKQRINALRVAFADKPLPPISVYEASDLYFVSDGHHRVALAREDGAEFIDAEVTALKLSHAITPEVDVLQLVHTEQNRQFMERSGLAESHPELQIEFSRPIGYWELTDLLEAYAYEESAKQGRFVTMPEATGDVVQHLLDAGPGGDRQHRLAQALLVQDRRRPLPVGASKAARAADDRPISQLAGRRGRAGIRTGPEEPQGNRPPRTPHSAATC